MPVTGFSKHHADKTITGEAISRRNMNWEVPVKEEVEQQSPLTGRSNESSAPSENKTKKKNSDKLSPHPHANTSFCSKRGSTGASDGGKFDKEETGTKEVSVFEPVSSQFLAVLDLNHYPL